MPDQPTVTSSNISLRARIRYRFDNLLARGTWAVLLWLGAITLGAVLVSSLLLTLFGVTFTGSGDGSWLEDFWQSLLRVLDTGTMAGDVGWGRRVLALLITIVGLLIAGTLIGLIATGIEQRVENLQRGRSLVVESGHVVILGSSARLPIVVHQLALARNGQKGNTIVVLSDDEPAELSRDLRAGLFDTSGSRLVVRFGDPSKPADLGIVNLREARAVIVLADEDARGDAGVVQAVLAAGRELGTFDRVPIVAELADLSTAASLVHACGPAVHPVVALQSVARTSAFAMREPGLNQVVEELLDFRGADVYLHDVGELAGVPFGEIVFRFANARPIGRMRPSGEVEINPHPDLLLEPADRLVVVADDGAELVPAAVPLSQTLPTSHRNLAQAELRQEHFLVIGWNALGLRLLDEWEQFAIPRSTVAIVYDATLLEPDDLGVPDTAGVDVTLIPTNSAPWQLAGMSEAEISRLTTIVFLGYRRGVTPDEADSRTLLNLLLVRRELEEWQGDAPRVVVELLDVDNVSLATAQGADDYLVSDAIGSRFMAQLAEQPDRRAVFLSLYAASGPSVRPRSL